jgi:hypothetical protein
MTLECPGARTTLGLQDPAAALGLVEVAGERVVAHGPKILDPQLVDRRSRRAQGSRSTEQVLERSVNSVTASPG